MQDSVSSSPASTHSTSVSPYMPWLIWGLAASFFFLEYIVRVAPSVMVPDLMLTFSASALAIGSLSAWFLYPYIAMQIPVGLLVDRYGPHRILTLMVCLCALGCLVYAIAPYLWVADLGRFMMGFSAAFAFVSALKLASLWFPPQRFALLAGLTQAVGMLGATLGEGPMSFLVAGYGWRHAMMIFTFIFLFLALLIGLLVRDAPSQTKTDREPSETEPKHLLVALKVVFANPQSWVNAACAGLIYGPTAVFAELWGVSFLVHAYGLGPHVAAEAISTIFLGWVVGGPLMGWLVAHLRYPRLCMIFSALSGLVIFLILLLAPSLPTWLIFVLMFIYGLTNTGLIVVYAIAGEINPRQYAGTSLALTNMASVIVGAILQPVIGYLIDLSWNGVSLSNGLPAYDRMDYCLALIPLPVCLLLAVVAIAILRVPAGMKQSKV